MITTASKNGDHSKGDYEIHQDSCVHVFVLTAEGLLLNISYKPGNKKVSPFFKWENEGSQQI